MEAEIRRIQAEHDKESEQNEKDILSKMQGDQGDETKTYRYDQNVKMLTALIAKKEAEEKVKTAELAAIAKSFADHKDLQAKLSETKELRAKIEAAKVKFQRLEIDVRMLQDTVEKLGVEKERLAEEKKVSDQKNEQLKTSLKQQENIS